MVTVSAENAVRERVKLAVILVYVAVGLLVLVVCAAALPHMGRVRSPPIAAVSTVRVEFAPVFRLALRALSGLNVALGSVMVSLRFAIKCDVETKLICFCK